MAQTITYICDRCGKPIDEDDRVERAIQIGLDEHGDVLLEDLHSKCADRVDNLLRQILLERYPAAPEPDPIAEPAPEPSPEPEPEPAQQTLGGDDGDDEVITPADGNSEASPDNPEPEAAAPADPDNSIPF